MNLEVIFIVCRPDHTWDRVLATITLNERPYYWNVDDLAAMATEIYLQEHPNSKANCYIFVAHIEETTNEL